MQKYEGCSEGLLPNYWAIIRMGIVDSSNTDLNSAWMAMGLRSVFDESTIVYLIFVF